MNMREYYRSQIREHAEQHLAKRGKVQVEFGYIDNDGVYCTIVALTTPDAIETWQAWADSHAVSMMRSSVTPLSKLPLLATQD